MSSSSPKESNLQIYLFFFIILYYSLKLFMFGFPLITLTLEVPFFFVPSTYRHPIISHYGRSW